METHHIPRKPNKQELKELYAYECAIWRKTCPGEKMDRQYKSWLKRRIERAYIAVFNRRPTEYYPEEKVMVVVGGLVCHYMVFAWVKGKIGAVEQDMLHADEYEVVFS